MCSRWRPAWVPPDADNTVRWWQRAGEKLTEFDVPGRIAALAFHPNGRDLFVSTFDGHQGVYRDGKLLQMTPGTPAKVMRLRQPEPIADRMIALAWWDWDHALLRARLADFRALSAEAFLEKYEG